MKSLYIGFCAILLVASCKKSTTTTTADDKIRAGISNVPNTMFVPIDPPFHNPGNRAHDIDLLAPLDFAFRTSQYNSNTTGYSHFSVEIAPLAESEIAVIDTIENIAQPLDYSQIIDENLIWTKNSVLLYSYIYSGAGSSTSTSIGPWLNLKDKYVGIRIFKNGSYYYGYYNVNVETDSNYFKHFYVYDAGVQIN